MRAGWVAALVLQSLAWSGVRGWSSAGKWLGVGPRAMIAQANLGAGRTTHTTGWRLQDKSGSIQFEEYKPIDSNSVEMEGLTNVLPDRAHFQCFFQAAVCGGSEIGFQQFLTHPGVKVALESALMAEEDVKRLWDLAVGDTSGLTVEEAYELLCMVQDLPDPEEEEFLISAFNTLQVNGQINWETFVQWEDVRKILHADALTVEELAAMWAEIAGGGLFTMGMPGFRMINRMIDDALE